MCDSTFAGLLPATYTSIDMANATKYAKMRLLREKVDAYNKKSTAPADQKPLRWVDRFPGTTTVSYSCPDVLKNTTGPERCWDGSVRIGTRAECLARNTFDLEKFKKDNTYSPGIKNGFPLQWLPPSSTVFEDGKTFKKFDTNRMNEGDCYFQNFLFKSQCQNSFYDPKEQSWASKGVCTTCGSQLIGTLKYDDDTGRCLITQKYCHAAGFNKYTAEDGRSETREIFRDNLPLPDGGKCELGTGQKFADFFIGSTFARGVVGGACPFMQGK